jgi:hypothetical protein
MHSTPQSHGMMVPPITVYIKPSEMEKRKLTMNQLGGILHSIFERLISSRVIVGGDFNEALEDAPEMLKRYGLSGVIPEGTSTHDKGGQLDQVFTNV